MQNSIYIADSSFLNDDKKFNEYYPLQSDLRKTKIDKLNVRESKNNSLLAGMILQRLISENNISNYEIIISQNGKPYEKNNKFHFSISHSGEKVAVAISDVPVGIDLELNSRESKKNIVDRYFCNEDKNKPFIQVWTCKESFTKLKDLNLFEVLKKPLDKNVFFSTIVSEFYTITICTEKKSEYIIKSIDGEF